ncbi:MAG: sigma 54-interacting transcriptional regulator [Acidobacteriota bacterium]|nr:sigma 54-interacting transcriptional regulator [Acidobacteriota bacterium]
MLETLEKFGRVLTETNGLRNALSRALSQLHCSIELEKSFVALVEPQLETLTLYATEGLSFSDYRKLETRLNKGLLKEVWEKAEELYFDKLSKEESFDYTSHKENAKLYAVPIIFQKKSIGIFCLETSKENLSFPFLRVLASMVSQAAKLQWEIAKEREKLHKETSYLQQEIKERYNFDNLIGNSNAMRQVYAQVSQVAKTNVTVLLRGESGTGKEMIANAIHFNSLRAKKPLVKINCAALPDTLIEAELFGYEKGAFTGAYKQKKGRFELADGGTIFLDEVGDLPMQTQVKLLRVLQEREFERLGGTETIRVNVRIIAATNKNLEEEIAKGRFREDLYYRLNVFTIFLPPLRERKSDILLLAEHFLEKYENIHGKHIKRISTPAIDMLTSYHWPGNVRELENAIERAVVACDGQVIHAYHLPPTLQMAETSGTVPQVSLQAAVAALEKDLIQDALKTTGGNCAKAAALLQTTERIFNYKVKKYGINPKRFRQ